MPKMIDPIVSTDPAVNRLIGEYLELRSLDKLATRYDVNVRYVWALLKYGIYPPLRMRKKLGMVPARVLTPLQIARDGMAAETKKAVKGWKA